MQSVKNVWCKKVKYDVKYDVLYNTLLKCRDLIAFYDHVV